MTEFASRGAWPAEPPKPSASDHITSPTSHSLCVLSTVIVYSLARLCSDSKPLRCPYLSLVYSIHPFTYLPCPRKKRFSSILHSDRTHGCTCLRLRDFVSPPGNTSLRSPTSQLPLPTANTLARSLEQVLTRGTEYRVPFPHLALRRARAHYYILITGAAAAVLLTMVLPTQIPFSADIMDPVGNSAATAVSNIAAAATSTAAAAAPMGMDMGPGACKISVR
jgi:hypothetical protein